MLKNDAGAFLVKECLSGDETTADELRQLYAIKEVSTEDCAAPEIGLRKAIKNTQSVGTRAEWYGRGTCHVDMIVMNPSRMRAMHKAGAGFGERFYKREMTVPVDFRVEFRGSDLDFIVDSCEVAEMILPPADADDDLPKAGYDFLAPRYGSGAAWREFHERARMVGIDERFICPAYEAMLNDVREQVRKDDSIRSAVEAAYLKEEKSLSGRSLRRFYSAEVLEAKDKEGDKKKDVATPPKRRRCHLTLIDGGKK